MSKPKIFCSFFSFALGIVLAGGLLEAQSPDLIKTAIDDKQLTAVARTTHPSARKEFDQGIAPPSLPMERMLLVLKRSREQQAALTQFLDELQQPWSVNYHKWLTPQQFGERFGATDADIQKVTAWLEGHGFEVKAPEAGRGVIEFSGSAGQVQETFHTEIHHYRVNGVEHWANASDQQIPAALADAVAGVSTLHNFTAAPQSSLGQAKVSVPQFSSGGSNYLSPLDYDTIYNVSPLYPAITGAGIKIAVVGRTDINITDVTTFRSLMGLPNNPPNLILNGTDPGDLGGGEEAEAVLDTSWAGALATNATVNLVVSATTNTTDGADLSELYIIGHPSIANIMTESFGSCEASLGQAQTLLYTSNAMQAVAEGISYTVSAGDSGSAGCDDFNTETSATGPVSVNGLASTPYNVAVGGTQFNENGSPNYWSSTNGTYFNSALSYIPEDVWNANCTGSVCGTGSIIAGGGGASTYNTKPSWQTGVAGIPADGARDVPDVSLTAAGHDAYLLCLDGGCNLTTGAYFTVIYGTSASAPSFASIIALIDQKAGSSQGLINTRLYALAASETLASCNGSNTAGLPAANCIFNDVTVGTNAVPGEANYNTASETYNAGVGFDLASGLGSVNVANLVNNWVAAVGVPSAGLSPQLLTFPTQTDGTTSAAQNLTLLNSGTGALTISSISIGGANASSFAQTNTCGTSLALGKSCTISVTFKPTAAGSLTATLTVTDNSGNVANSTQSATLNGTGSSVATPTTFTTYLSPYGSGLETITGSPVVLPLRAYNPTGASQIQYLSTDLVSTVSGSAEYTAVVKSDGAGGYTLFIDNEVTVVPNPYLELSASGSTVTLSTPLTVGSLTVTAYRFALVGNEMQLDLTATRSGSFNDEVVIYASTFANAYSYPWRASDGIWTSGATGGPAAVTLSPTSVNFGTESVGAPVTQSVTVTNSGGSALTVSSVTVTGTNTTDFSATNGCTASVAPAASCTITVTFDPTTTGARSATLSISDNATGSPQTVPLSGTGTTAATPTTFTTYLAPYGSGLETITGSPAALPLRAYNPGGASQIQYLITDLVSTTTGSTEYSAVVKSDGAGGYTLFIDNGVTIVPNPYLELSATGTTVTLTTPLTLGSLTVTAYRFALAGNEMQLDLTAARSGTFSDQIVIYASTFANAYSYPWRQSDGEWVSGATGGPPAVTLSPTSLNFGTDSVGTKISESVTVTNSGGSALTVSSVTVTGTNPTDFSETNGCTSSVAAGASCTITVTFDPTTTGARSATLSIADNVTGSPQTVALSGTGTTAATPTTFTTYLAPYGSGLETITGSPAILPLRAYNPTGAAQIQYMTTDLVSATTGAAEYTAVVRTDGAGGYQFFIDNEVTEVPYPYLELSASGTTVTLSTPLTVGTFSVTAYRFELAGNEMQLDLTVKRTDATFNDQIVIYASTFANAYSYPWRASDGNWIN